MHFMQQVCIGSSNKKLGKNPEISPKAVILFPKKVPPFYPFISTEGLFIPPISNEGSHLTNLYPSF